jgi:hypothetical protein
MQRWRHVSMGYALVATAVLLGLGSPSASGQAMREPPASMQRGPGDQIESTPLPLAPTPSENRLRKREELRLYERDLQTWCEHTAPQRLEECMRDSLVRHGLAPTFFRDRERALENPPQEEPPRPRQAAPPVPSSQPQPFWPPPPSFPPPRPQERPLTPPPGRVQAWATSKAQVCAALGQAAALITRARDAGEPLGSVLQRLRREPLGDPVVDEWREELSAEIYASPGLTPERAQHAAEAKCVRQMQGDTP